MRSLVFGLLVITAISLQVVPYVSAHPGNTDGSGGHTCRTNCPSWGLSYGEYHYHDGSSSPGYTAPDPEEYEEEAPEPDYSDYSTEPDVDTSSVPESSSVLAANTEPEVESEGSSPWGWIVGGLVVLGLLGAASEL